MAGYVSAINVAPLKSGRAIYMNRVWVNERGLAYDREYMVVNKSGKFLSQRDVPRLALVTPRLNYEEEYIRFSAPDMPDIFHPMAGRLRGSMGVNVHRDSCDAIYGGAQIGQWFSEFLGIPRLELVRVDPDNPRRHFSSALGREFPGNFQDGSHALIISRASLDDFNGRVAEPLPMNRFRPTIEVSGIPAYAEDGWGGFHLRIGQMEMLGANLCVRCVVTTTDQDTGLRDQRQEPLRTLATYRKTLEGEVVFGINCYIVKGGFVNVGDTVDILS